MFLFHIFYSILILCLTKTNCEIEDLIQRTEDNILYDSYLIGAKLRKSLIQINNTCGLDVLNIIEEMHKGKLWAMKMFDASPKVQSGILLGNVFNFGSYEECLSSEGRTKNRVINPKYCVYMLFVSGANIRNISADLIKKFDGRFRSQAGVPILESICVPDSCDIEDLQYAFNLTGLSKIIQVQQFFAEDYCQVNNSKNEFTSVHALFLFFVVGDILLIILCTVYDMYLQRNEKKPLHKILISFSLYTNFKQLTKISKGPDQLSCINGIRTLSMAWIILGHRFLLSALFPHINYIYTVDWIKETTTSLIQGSLFAVDTFFVISGILVMYVVLLAKSNNFKFNIIIYYIHRIIRLLPPLIMVILLYMTYMKDFSFGMGPVWPLMYNSLIKQCQSHWWYSVLFVQNIFMQTQEICVSQSWYLAVDTQLYALAPLLFLPIQKSPKMTIIAMIILIIISNAYTFYTSWTQYLDVSILSPAQVNPLHKSILSRSCDWFIGCILGYILFIKRKEKIIIQKYIVIILWILSIAASYTLIYLGIYYNRQKYNRISSSIYFTLSRTVWSVSLSWIIFACVHGYGGLINSLLSNRLFIVTGRLSYSMFLTHVIVIYSNMAKNKEPTVFSNSSVLYVYWTDLFYTFLLSVVWCLCFESPFIAMEKVLLPQDIVRKIEEINEGNETAHKQQSEFDTHL